MDLPTCCTKAYAHWNLRPSETPVQPFLALMGATRCYICKEILGGHSKEIRHVRPWDRIISHFVKVDTSIISLVAHMDCVTWCDNLVAAKCSELHDRYLDILMTLWRTDLCKDIVRQIARALIGIWPIRTQVLLALA